MIKCEILKIPLTNYYNTYNNYICDYENLALKNQF